MSYYIPVQFSQLNSSENGTPFVELNEEQGDRSVRVAVNGYDANRLAITSFKMLEISVTDLSSTIIKSLGAQLESVKIEFKGKKHIACYLIIKTERKSHQVIECRVGEGVFLSITDNAPLLVEEALFTQDEELFSLKNRIRKLQTDSLATFRIT